MKKPKFQPFSLLYNVLVWALIFSVIGTNMAYALPCGIVIGTLLAFVMPKTKEVVFGVVLQKTIWSGDIERNLYADNSFLKTFRKAAQENIKGRTVVIPQAGVGGDVVKNRTTLPATVKTRTDTPTSYEIAEWTSDPMRVSNADEAELDYDKRNDIMQDERDKLSANVAEDVLLNIVNPGVGTTTTLPAGRILVTDGAAVAATAPDATGNRKAYRLNDFQRARSFFIREKTWVDGAMYALITGEAEAQIFPAESEVTAAYMRAVTEEERRNGVMYKVQGFQIITRSSVYVFNNAGTFKPSTAAGAATDDEGILFYNGRNCEFALGDIEIFDETKSPIYYSDIFSFLVRAGARARRENMEGLLVIKQAKTA